MRIMLDVPLAFDEVAEALGTIIQTYGQCDTIYCVTTDSREAEAGDLFFPLAVHASERLAHLRDAMQRGALTVGDENHSPTLAVRDTRRALLRLSTLYKSKLTSLRHTVGVTGSVGKTTVTRFITHLLSRCLRVCSTIGNFNNIIGLSLSILCAPCDTEVLVLELGMNHTLEIAELAAAIKPDVCVITNIGTAHVGNLGSREAIARAKCEIITDACRHLVCPADEPLLYGVKNRRSISLDADADFVLRREATGYSFISPYGRLDNLQLAQDGEHDLKNAAAAATVAQLIGQDDLELRKGMESLSSCECRARITRVGELTLVDDTYNSSYEAAVAMLKLIQKYPAPHTVVFGDMLELGDLSVELHERLGVSAAEEGIDYLIAIGNFADDIRRGAIKGGLTDLHVKVFSSLEAATDETVRAVRAPRGGTVLFKGSHATGLSRIVSEIKDKEIRDE